MTIAHTSRLAHPNTLPKRTGLLVWCLVLMACCLGICQDVQAQEDPPDRQRITVELIELNGKDRIMLKTYDFPPGDYEIWIDKNNGAGPQPTYILIHIPEPNERDVCRIFFLNKSGRQEDGNGNEIAPAPERNAFRLFRLDRDFWVRPKTKVRGGPHSEAPNPAHDNVETAPVIDSRPKGFWRWWFGAAGEPGQGANPGMNTPAEPMVLANVAGTDPEFLQTRAGYDQGTTITVTLDPAQASFAASSPTLMGSGAQLSVTSQSVEVLFTEDWDLFDGRSVEIDGIGVQVHDDVPWVRMMMSIHGRMDELVTHAEDGDLSMFFGEPGEEVVRQRVYRIAGTPNSGDTDGDGLTNVEDLLEVIYNFGQDAQDNEADTNLDDTIDVMDILEVIYNWRNDAAQTL